MGGGGEGAFANGTGNARGVCTLINKNSGIVIKKQIKDEAGRFVLCEIEKDGVTMNIMNLYAPNQDNPEFFNEINVLIKNYFDNTVLIGDFNMVRDVKLNRRGSEYNNTRAAQNLDDMMEDFGLEEIWRNIHPDKIRFSWHKVIHGRGLLASRIDYAIVPRGLCKNMENCFYLTGIKSDHSAFFLGFDINPRDRGPGFWKLNTTLLSDIEYIQDMNQHLDEVLESKKRMELERFWELLKFQIAQQSKNFS